MKSITLSAIALSIAVTGLTGSAVAQTLPVPAGKLFFEGDIVRHNIEGQQGPFCVLNNRFTRGEAIAWRQRILKPDGTPATDADLTSVIIEMNGMDVVDLEYGPHGNPPTDYFWAESWQIPENYPTGSVGYKVKATMNDGTVVTWEPFTRPNSQLTIIEGTPTMAAN
jgi:hypothetical protein